MENKVERKQLPAWLVLCIIALVAALALAVTNAITEGPIRERALAVRQATYNAVMPAADYQEISLPAGYEKVSGLFEAKDADGHTVGYAVTASAQGYGGPVAVNLGISPEGRVVGVGIGDTSFAETDGFGARWRNPDNQDRLLGLDAVNGGAFEALSGATRTSNAVLEAANAALKAVREVALKQAPAAEPLVVFGKNNAAGGGEAAAAAQPGATLQGTAKGFGDAEVTATVKLDDAGQIAELTVDASTQTEGIGQRCAEEEFTAQFIGKSIPLTLGEDVDALSGATVTSGAVVEAINGAVPYVQPGATLRGTAKGFGDAEVTATVKLDDAGQIAELTVDASTQTEGIGQRCAEEEFTAQFVGRSIPLTLGEDVDALSGATVTSGAVVEAINGAKAVDEAAEVLTVLYEDKNGVVALTAEGALKFIPAEGFTGSTNVTIQMENGQVTGVVPIAEAPAETSAADENMESATVKGFGDGDIILKVAKNEDGSVAKLVIDAGSQTPGLGLKAEEAGFTDQFIGKTGPFTLGENVDAIAGATITSQAVVDGMNQLLGAAAETPAEEPAAEEAEVFKGSAFGYESDINVALTVDAEGKIATLTVDAKGETKGLGQNTMEEAFTSQFIGKSGPFAVGENVDAVTNATFSTKAAVEAVNKALEKAGATVEAPAETTVETPAETPSEEADAEVYKASAFGYESDVNVALTVDAEGKIATLTVDAKGETKGLGQNTMEEAFTSQFIGKSGPFAVGENVDAVTNATFSTKAAVEAVNKALEKAGATVEAPVETLVETPAEMPAETPSEEAEAEVYRASAFGYESDVNVALTVDAEGKIATLTVDAKGETKGLGQNTMEEAFTSQFIGKSGPFAVGENVDVVTNATFSTKAVVEAVNKALEKAGVTVEAPAETPVEAPAETPSEEAGEAAAEALTITVQGYDDGHGADVIISLTKNADGTIATLTIDAATQTIGLGKKAGDEAFTSQFIGQTGPFTLHENVDAITNATVTSTAVVEGINELLGFGEK